MIPARPLICVPTPADIAAAFGASTYAHWPVHSAETGVGVATVSATQKAFELWEDKTNITLTGTGPIQLRETTATGRHYNFHTPIGDSARTASKATIRCKASGAKQWIRVDAGANIKANFDLVNGVTGLVAAGVTAAIVPAGSGYLDVSVEGTLITANPSFLMELLQSNLTLSVNPSYAGNVADGIDVASVTYSQTRAQQVNDTGPRSAHLVMSTPASQPGFNSWDPLGSRLGLPVLRHPSGLASYMDAVDAVLGTAVNTIASAYAVVWGISSEEYSGNAASMLQWTNAALTSVDDPLYLGSTNGHRMRSGVATAYSAASSKLLSSRVAALNGASFSRWRNGVDSGSGAIVSPADITADRVRLFNHTTSWEGVFLGGGIFVFPSAAAMNAALPAIHRMVAAQRALWGL